MKNFKKKAQISTWVVTVLVNMFPDVSAHVCLLYECAHTLHSYT